MPGKAGPAALPPVEEEGEEDGPMPDLEGGSADDGSAGVVEQECLSLSVTPPDASGNAGGSTIQQCVSERTATDPPVMDECVSSHPAESEASAARLTSESESAQEDLHSPPPGGGSGVILPLAELRASSREKLEMLGVDLKHAERHLSSDDFQEAFSMSAENFESLPDWKQKHRRMKAKIDEWA
eukprot:Hpha_TRINITY_DN15699_c0_g1::TRINITY_DN15699_c0_g1_i3::g.98434::m.98434